MNKHEAKMKRLEQKFLRKVYKAIRSDFLEFTAILKKDGLDAAIRKLDTIVINQEIGIVIRDIYTAIGLPAAKQTLREINGEQKGFGINEELIAEIISYFKNYLLNKAVIPISETTKEQILEVLSKAQKEGWGVDKIAYELESSELSLYRARMIVRTETLKANFYGQKLGRDKAKWESEKTWLSASDHRTRHSHVQVNGMKRDDNERFPVPIYKRIGKVDIQIGIDYMLGPGDLQASAGNVINCRCTLTHKAKRDENGRLIPKRNVSVIQPGSFVRNNPIITI
jgi:hypothetical protein